MDKYIGENIKRLRVKQGMSVERVARMIETEASMVEKWESGIEIPDAGNIDMLARLFDVDINVIIGVTGEKSDYSTVKLDNNSNYINETPASNKYTNKEKNYYGEGNNTEIYMSPLASYIGRDEKVLWYGQPTTEKVGGRDNGFIILFGIFWLAIAIFWTMIAMNIGGIFSIFGLFFIGIGIYMVFGKSMILDNNKKNIFYAVTDKRVMLCIKGHINRFRDIRYRKLNEVRLILSRRGTGCGTIVFISPTLTPEYPYGRNYDRTLNTNNILDSFVDINDAKSVYDIINTVKADSLDE